MHMNPAKKKFGRQRIAIIEDMSKPINVVPPPENVHIAILERGELLLNERSNHGRRTVIRITPEIYCRSRASDMTFNRLPSAHVLLSCPSPGQARAAIRLIQRVCESLDGKFLAEDE